MQNVYKNIEECNAGKKRKVSIVSDDMIADTINNKKNKYTSNRIVYQKQKIRDFNCLYYSIIF